MIFGLIDQDKVTDKLIFAPRDTKVYPVLEMATEAASEEEAVIAVATNFAETTAANLTGVEYRVLGTDRAICLVMTEEIREKQGAEIRVNFILQMLGSLQQQAVQFAGMGAPMPVDPVILLSLTNSIATVLIDFAKGQGVEFKAPVMQKTEVGPRKDITPPILGPGGEPLKRGGNTLIVP